MATAGPQRPYKLPESVLVVIHTPALDVLLIRRADAPEHWQSVTGSKDWEEEDFRATAVREVMEETGHEVSVHEFLGTLAYDSGGRSKIVHFWRMEAANGPVRKLMADVTAVDWLPLGRAIKRLSREHERAFLENVGPLALQAVAPADVVAAPAAIDEAAEIPLARKGLVQRMRDWLRGAA